MEAVTARDCETVMGPDTSAVISLLSPEQRRRDPQVRIAGRMRQAGAALS